MGCWAGAGAIPLRPTGSAGAGVPSVTLLLSGHRFRWALHQQRPRGPAALPADSGRPAQRAGGPPAQARLRGLPGAPADRLGHWRPHLQDEVRGGWGRTGSRRRVLAAWGCLTPPDPAPGTGTAGTTSPACTRTRGAASSRRRTTASRWRRAACPPAGPRSSPTPTTAPTRASCTSTNPSSGGRGVGAGDGPCVGLGCRCLTAPLQRPVPP